MRSFSTRTAGLLILILGVWGGLVPFIGPYFHFTLGPTKAWTWTNGRLYLDVLPGIAAVLAGLMLLSAGPRPGGRLAALLGIAAGVWFAIGPDVSVLWNSAGAQGAAHGARGARVLEMLGYHTGLGALMAAIAGYALPRFVRPAAAAEPVAATGVAGRRAGYAAQEPVVAGRGAPVRGDGALAGAGTAAMAAREERAAAPAGTTVADPAATTTGEPVGTTAGEPVGTTARAAGEPVTTTAPAAGEPVAADEPIAASPATTAAPAGATAVHGRRRRRGGLLSVLSRR